jgi:hypothetical protein
VAAGVSNIWLALLVGAALTMPRWRGRDGQPGGPARIRRLINVERGLNDGIATPFVLVAITGTATADHAKASSPPATPSGQSDPRLGASHLPCAFPVRQMPLSHPR